MQASINSQKLNKLKVNFLAKHRLPEMYWESATKWFLPLFEKIFETRIQENKPLFIGINGAQGSGKSTLTDLALAYFNEILDLPSIGFSIDDFYFSKSDRTQLSQKIHPLLSTRGVPGTHNIHLLQTVLEALQLNHPCKIPKFEKAVDDLISESEWQKITQPYQVIILEGWCVGSRPAEQESLTSPINTLEKNQDPKGIWRQHVNDCLSNEYRQLFSELDLLIMLCAPSFDAILDWRIEQEHKMLSALNEKGVETKNLGMSDEQIAEFIAYYQRITEDNMTRMPEFCDFLFRLDNNRNIISCTQN